MTYSKPLANRLREVVLEGTWIANTNFKAQLESLDWQVATRPIQPLNNIALLAQHAHYYIKGIKNTIEHGVLSMSDAQSFSFEEIQSQLKWKSFLDTFWSDTEQLAQLIESMSDDDLNRPFVDEKYGSVARNFDGLIEHCYYHLGQIVLVKKMILNAHIT
jgi:hypothetical protein